MENVLSGSGDPGRKKDDFMGPLDLAKEDALKFIFGLQTLTTFKTIADRIQLIEAMLNLPLVQSGSTKEAYMARNQYIQEMKELEIAIKIFCSMPSAPEA